MHITLFKPPVSALRLGSLCIASAVLSLSAASAMAAARGPVSEIQARYAQERARCLNGTSNEDRDTCLKEAGAARAAAMQGKLDEGNDRYRQNALERCKALSGADAKDCIARMNGAGTTSGSAEAGGIFRELVTREVPPADMPASAAPAH
ncbi:MAG TPA: hypothetical protein VIM34_22600 [Burkholderiaceae bacterium]